MLELQWQNLLHYLQALKPCYYKLNGARLHIKDFIQITQTFQTLNRAKSVWWIERWREVESKEGWGGRECKKNFKTFCYSYIVLYNSGCGKITSFFIWHFIFKKGS
jgi:hypothetical protein